MGANLCSVDGTRGALASCGDCSTVDAADWIFCLEASDGVKPQGRKNKRRAKDAYAEGASEVDLRRLEDLTRELFKAHDLNDDGMLQEMELVKLNEQIAILHHGKSQDEIAAVRETYHKLFRTKLDPDGRPVPYEVFRKYARGVLEELDSDPEAQEMILEQFVAEAKAGRDAMDVASLMPDDSAPLEQRLAEIPSARGTNPTAEQAASRIPQRSLDEPVVAGSGHRALPEHDSPSNAGLDGPRMMPSSAVNQIDGLPSSAPLPDGI
eukprot:TRINITY_DN50049_c0_g1_i1.p1 TRINITY_DN50049_c0_g1~~TRINITY_DN50049_c0_g1_i1.p1  ORF type:complete len:308 (-),score=52.97 TRINITY_DN50049_c0_g1_i1:108-905(-)